MRNINKHIPSRAVVSWWSIKLEDNSISRNEKYTHLKLEDNSISRNEKYTHLKSIGLSEVHNLHHHHGPQRTITAQANRSTENLRTSHKAEWQRVN